MAFPLETFYAASHLGIDRIGRQYAMLVDVLVRNGYQLDIFSAAQIATAEITGGKIILHRCEFSSLIFPYGSIMSAEALEFIRKARDAGIPVITDLLAYDRSTPTELLPFRPPIENEIKAVMDAVRKVIDVISPTCDLPHGAIANVRKVEEGYRVLLMAAQPLGEYEGTFRYSGVEVEIEKRTDPLQLLLELTD